MDLVNESAFEVMFCDEVRRFCAFMRAAQTLELPHRLDEARMRVAALYASIALLPLHPPVSEAERPDFARSVVPPFDVGELDFYYLYFDPYNAAEAELTGSLRDDLGDIYLDVEEGLQAWDAGDRIEAVWLWRFSFHAHWGRHAVGALPALHEACYRCPRLEE